MLFLTLVTSSYYQNVLKQVGDEGGEDGNGYRYHYVMIVEDSDMPFWKDVYESTREAARENNALVELMGKSLSSTIEMESLMDMAIASRVDGIILEYTGGHKIDERINDAGKAGIPVVTVLKDASDTSRISFVGVNDYQLGPGRLSFMSPMKEAPRAVHRATARNSIPTPNILAAIRVPFPTPISASFRFMDTEPEAR